MENFIIKSSTAYQAKLIVPLGVAPPDVFDSATGSFPPDDFVVTRDRAGNPASLFKHLKWDYAAYNREGKAAKLIFIFWDTETPTQAHIALSLEARLIIFSLIWRRGGKPLSIGTLQNYLSVINAVAAYAYDAKSTIGKTLANETAIWDFVISRCSGWTTETLTSLLPQLYHIGADALGFSVVNSEGIERLKLQNAIYRQGIKQHPPMPTRIYAHFLSGLLTGLAEWLEVADDILAAAEYCAKDPRAGRAKGTQRNICKARKLSDVPFLTLEEVLSNRSIEYFKARGKIFTVSCLSAILGDAQYMLQLIIQAFTGMREDEGNSLPYDCAHTTVHRHRTYYLVHGRTTKFSNGLAQKCRWVTNEEGHAAISAAKRIADVIYGVMKVTVESNDERLSKYPLFISVAYLGLMGDKKDLSHGFYGAGTALHRRPPSIAISNIEEGDLLELEQIDPHRAWRSEAAFRIGQPWSFTDHQLRRSLALYAQRSGLVSLPSLRRQLKHLTDDMARYYGKGSAFARDFLSDEKEHFGLEWQKAQVESSALSYWLKISSDESFKGGHGSFIKRRSEQSEKTVLEDREATFKLFHKGELAFKEIALGGCTSVSPCDKVGIQWLPVACITDDCKNLMCSKGKLDRVIAAQTVLVNGLDKNSMEFRTDSNDLRTFIKFREKFNC